MFNQSWALSNLVHPLSPLSICEVMGSLQAQIPFQQLSSMAGNPPMGKDSVPCPVLRFRHSPR